MSNALPHDLLVEKEAPLPVRRPTTALVRVVPDRLMALGTEASIWKRLERVPMSEMERRAAVDALLLGRDIGKALQKLGRAMDRWLGRSVATKHVRHASFRHLVRLRRARVPPKRLR